MLLAERNFIDSFDQENLEKSQEDLLALIANIVENNPSQLPSLRFLKNYLSGLNSILFEKTYLKPSCKKSLLQHKLRFYNRIEKTRDLEELEDLALLMLNFYLKSLGRKCSMVNPIINQALIYIDNNLDREDLGLRDLAQNLNVSRSYLSHLFKKTLGISFSKYLNLRRVEKAKLLIETTNMSLMETAMECGFNSQSYFSYIFKEIECLTPSEYRCKKNRQGLK